ncbi:acireductone synthase [Micromonospora sp. LOL_021]|uniref:acireductone synthase n=1 Tax=Micromonospora sp. LOL_021 TaxID=3345417 RepID=UPI003A89CA3F
MIRSVVLDVEGTTSSVEYVHQRLFPYSREVLPDWVPAHSDEPAVASALRAAAGLAGRPEASPAEVVEFLLDWIRQDAKLAPLKTIQGLIWQDALASGALAGHVYDDVPPAIRAWAGQGLTVHIFSSGSVTAQKAWFRHTSHGDLVPYLTAFFDLENAGVKHLPDSYRAIARSIGTAPDSILFLSDVTAELDAARWAGWRTVAVQRNGASSTAGGHLAIADFDELELTASAVRPVGVRRSR